MSFIAGYLMGLGEGGGVTSRMCDVFKQQDVFATISPLPGYRADWVELPPGVADISANYRDNAYHFDGSRADYMYLQEDSDYCTYATGVYDDEGLLYVCANTYYPIKSRYWMWDWEKNVSYLSSDYTASVKHGDIVTLRSDYRSISYGVPLTLAYTSTSYDSQGNITAQTSGEELRGYCDVNFEGRIYDKPPYYYNDSGDSLMRRMDALAQAVFLNYKQGG